MGLSYTANRGLFSDHYLATRLPELPEWDGDYDPLRSRLSALLEEKADALPTLSEAQTEQQFIRPALDALGWSYETQITFRALGRDYRPEYALFLSEDHQRAARATVSAREEPCGRPYLDRAAALAEAKYWERPLEERRPQDTRDRPRDRGRSPHFQIIDYLRDSGVRWGILTNGRTWRLRHAEASVQSPPLAHTLNPWRCEITQHSGLDSRHLRWYKPTSPETSHRRRPNMAEDILDAVYGCLVAGAIGDALGAPVEGWYYQDIRREHGKVDRFMPFETGYSVGAPGTVTDDSVLRHYLCLAIAEKGGRVTPDDYAEVWIETLNPDRLWTNESIVRDKLRTGMNPYDTGRGTPPTGCATMAIAPVGVINAGNPGQAYQDGLDIAAVNQDGVNRDAAASVAAGVAAAFLPEATPESLIETMMEFSSEVLRRGYVLTMDLAEASADVDEFAVAFYERMLDWTWPSRHWDKECYFSGDSLEFVPVVMALLHFYGGDPRQCLIEGASFGRDCDTIAGVCGNLVGALHGASALPQEWIETSETANAEFFREVHGDPEENFHAMAARLVEALRQEKRAAQRRGEQLGLILD